jgi:hypothetical protein
LEDLVNTVNCGEKNKNVSAVMEWDDMSAVRGRLYAELMKAMVNEFGDGVLDIAESIRRENGKYCGDMAVDIIEQERKYNEDPAILIQEMDDMQHNSSPDWALTCKCVFQALPEERRHHLYCFRCTYPRSFPGEDEKKIGITWCCWDMGFTAAFHPLFCQYMPKHMLKGDSLCWQVRRLAETPEQQEWLNSVEHTGWRSYR